VLPSAGIVPVCSVLLYFFATKNRLPIFQLRALLAYLAVVFICGVVYMLRHREELRDPPAQRERQRQCALKNRSALLNLLIVICLLNVIAGAFFIHRGYRDAFQANMIRVATIASVPAIVFLVFAKRRLRIKGVT